MLKNDTFLQQLPHYILQIASHNRSDNNVQ